LSRYLYALALSVLLSLGAVWLWILAVPIAFMDPEYASWRAKQILLARCDLGDVIILGDSRAAVDVVPALLPVKTTNFAVGGGEPVEAYAVLTRALACPTPPKLVIMSFDPGHFSRPDLLWERSVRFGLLSAADLTILRALSTQTGDFSVYAGRGLAGLPLRIRDWLEEIRFPPLYFATLAHSVGLVRWSRNQHTLELTLASRGQYFFGTEVGSDAIAIDGHLPDFRPLPVLDAYFDRMLALLEARGIETRFVAMPVNEATWAHMAPSVREDFRAYLATYASRYKRFHVVDDFPEHWPDHFFGDQFCHLNPEGAERLSALLAQRLQAAPPSTQNEAQNGWFNDTGRDASAKVEPSSKRGS
jgi:hypothetical protein